MSHLSNHKPTAPRPVPVPPFCRGACLTIASVWLFAPLLGGCALTVPMSSLRPGSDDVTASNATTPFARLLDEEDRRREKAALATALDPQSEGGLVRWENPRSGNKGSLRPMGLAYNVGTKVCRNFVAELKDGSGERTARGAACAVAAGEWDVTDLAKTRS